jgi:histidine triad (HIT) family protein
MSIFEKILHLVRETPGWVADLISAHPWIGGLLIAILVVLIALEIHDRLSGDYDEAVYGCGFCTSANGHPITRVVREWRDVVALETLHPLVPGHIVVVPRKHVVDAGHNPRITARVMRCAAELVAELPSANIITSKGRAATQNFDHLHVHVLPRRGGDNLVMPWTGQLRNAS